MSDSPFLHEVTGHADFAEAVLEASLRVPVLVDFWADWCAPCKMQLPVLLKLLEELQGKFLLAKVNTEAQPQLASEHGIRSLPTLRLYHQGRVVQEALGVQTDDALRALLAPYLERESDLQRRAALEAYAAGRSDEALELLRAAAHADPQNSRLALDYVRLLMETGKLDAAADVLNALPREVRESPEAAAVAARLSFAAAVQHAPQRPELEQHLAADAGQHQARYQLAARLVVEGQYEAAMQQLLELLRRNRDFGDDAARKGLLALFELLGNEDERVVRYRRQLFNILH